MPKLKKILAAVFAGLFVLTSLAGCTGSSGKSDPTAVPTAANTQNGDPTAVPTAANTQNGDPTEVPEWMWTPDPAKFILGEDGFYEDQYLSAYWPAYLEYKSSSASNNALYIGYPEGSDKKLAFSYTTDEGGDFEEELGGMDFDSFEQYIVENMNSYFVLQEFGYSNFKGHRMLRAVYNYDPPEEPNRFTRVLQYSIEVNGWILNLSFTTQADAFPEECITCIDTIRFKDGY